VKFEQGFRNCLDQNILSKILQQGFWQTILVFNFIAEWIVEHFKDLDKRILINLVLGVWLWARAFVKWYDTVKYLKYWCLFICEYFYQSSYLITMLAWVVLGCEKGFAGVAWLLINIARVVVKDRVGLKQRCPLGFPH